MDCDSDDVTDLLAKVGEALKKIQEARASTDDGFNIFSVCGVDYYENMHSKILAAFLDPKGAHGLGTQLLANFIKVLDKGDLLDLESTRVITEYSFNDGRMDILLKDGENNVVGIENKIRDKEGQPKQLVRYSKHLHDKYKGKKIQLLYLTPDGREASKGSALKEDRTLVEYTRISYCEHILKWIQMCVISAEKHPRVRETLCQYKTHLRKELSMNSDQDNTRNMEMFFETKEKARAAFYISKALKGVKKEILSKVVQPCVKDVFDKFRGDKPNVFKDEYEWNISFDNENGRFCQHFADNRAYYIAFEFGSGGYRGLFFGLKKVKEGPKGTPPFGDRDFNSSSSWVCWKAIPNDCFKSWEDDFFVKMKFEEEFRSDFKEMLRSCLDELMPAISASKPGHSN